VTLSAGLERAIGLLDPARRPRSAAVHDGYLDLLGGAGRRGGSPAQRLMLTRGLPVVYERWWRPAWGRVLMGPLGPGTKGERQIAHELLELGPGDTVLDIACGPGNFVREFAGSIGKRGLVVGLDTSQTMLARAVEDTGAARNVAYVRGDAIRLPFRDGSFDAVTSAHFFHHFTPDENAGILGDMLRVTRRVVLVNDTRRHRLPLLFVQLLGALRLVGRITRFDAPGSVRRGYTVEEARDIAKRVPGGRAEVVKLLPFRFGILLWK